MQVITAMYRTHDMLHTTIMKVAKCHNYLALCFTSPMLLRCSDIVVLTCQIASNQIAN